VICGDKTEVIFNINFKATNICEGCATSIFLQQAQWYVAIENKKSNQNLINVCCVAPKGECDRKSKDVKECAGCPFLKQF
jgi:hypothetical protein